MKIGFFKILAGLALFLLVAIAPVAAQDGAVGANGEANLAEAGDATLDRVAAELTSLSKNVDSGTANEAKLASFRASLEAEIKKISELTGSLQSRLSVIEERLKAMGDAPAEESTPEESIVARERSGLESEKAAISGVLGRAEDLSAQASEIGSDIATARQLQFTGTLFKRTTIDRDTFLQAQAAVSEQWSQLIESFESWLKFIWKYRRLPLMGAIFFSCLTALLIAAFGYRVFGPFLVREQGLSKPPYIRRLSVAFWSTVLPSASVAAFAASIYLFLDGFNVLRSDIAPIVSSALKVAVVLFFVVKLVRSVLAPVKPDWRLVDVSDKGAWSLSVCVMVLTVINSIDYFIGSIYTALSAPLVLTVVNSFIAALLAGLVFLIMAFIRPLPHKEDEAEELLHHQGSWPPLIRALLSATGFVLIIAALLGYVGLARFVSAQLVLTGAVLVTMGIGFVSGRAISQPHALSGTYLGVRLQERFTLSDVALDQLGLVSGLSIYFFVLVVGIPLILLQWGFYAQDMWLSLQAVTTNISFGSIRISLVNIVIGVLLFLLGLYFSRWLLRWFDGNVLARSNLDPGVRNSLHTGLNYVGAGLAVIIGISAAGIDLSSLALVAGALSLGIGFGLQTIVSNFVSGLILLVERPFKVGDWVVTGSTEGIVKHISVRATEIETFQSQSIIVPNSELINASLGNWTHRNKLGRSDVAVGVSYDSDPQKVFEILLEVGAAHPKALKNPEPSVEFVGFGDSSIDFVLRIHLANVLDGFHARNDLRLAIFKRFKEEGIEIPFPQRDINIRVEELEKLKSAGKAEPKGADLQSGSERTPVADNMGGLDDDEDGDSGER